MTWLGEHDQESDMALYATQPADNVVGPGICRSEYGGFLLSYPPRRMYDVWQDEDYSLRPGKGGGAAAGRPGLFPAKNMWSTWRRALPGAVSGRLPHDSGRR